MAARDTQPIVTEKRLDLSMIAPADRELVLECGQPRAAREFRIRGRLDTDRMIDALQLEQQINEALKTDDSTKLIQALDAGNRYVRELLLELNDPETVPEKMHLDEQQTLMTLAWISGDVSVADAIARVITAGVTGALSEEELDDADTGDGEAGVARAGSAAPLA